MSLPNGHDRSWKVGKSVLGEFYGSSAMHEARKQETTDRKGLLLASQSCRNQPRWTQNESYLAFRVAMTAAMTPEAGKLINASKSRRCPILSRHSVLFEVGTLFGFVFLENQTPTTTVRGIKKQTCIFLNEIQE